MASVTNLVPAFSIHDDLWHNCWVAATAVRGRKEMLRVEECIQQRVARLLKDYGPESSLPLTLRIYGTMLKGFCVLNNHRARALQGDCERLIVSFAAGPLQQMDAGNLSAAGTKRKHIDAMMLDLNIKKVREAEAFDWSQAPLEEGAYLQLVPMSDYPALPLVMSQMSLLDEAFPAIDVPTADPVDFAAAAQPGNQADEAMQVAGPEDEGPAQEGWQLVLPALARRPGADDAWSEALAALAARGRLPRNSVGQLLSCMGHVRGFDEDTILPPSVAEAWHRDDGAISVPLLGPATRAELRELEFPERLGLLRPLLVDPRASACMLKADLAEDAPAPSLGGIGGQLVRLVTGEAPAPRAAEGSRSQRGQDDLYDQKAVRVGELLRQHAAIEPDRHGFPFEELLPPKAVDRSAAAMAFHALLTLATAGEILVEQSAPFASLFIIVS